MTANPFLASQVQQMASHERNEKIALAMSVASVALVGVMVWKELSHCMQERFRENDREHSRRHYRD
jgi:hypothetical protein